MKYLLEETDKIDAGKLTREDVLNPQGYVLISMTTDGRNAGDEPYWLRVIELLREETLENMLNDSEVKRRCRQILDEQEQLRGILLQRTTLKGNVIYADLRGIDNIPDGNRFLVFTLFPEGNIQVKVADDTQRPNTTAISVGYNIFNPTSKVNVGELLQRIRRRRSQGCRLLPGPQRQSRTGDPRNRRGGLRNELGRLTRSDGVTE